VTEKVFFGSGHGLLIARIGWEVFLLSAIMALTISIFTISFLSIKAARANPLDSLRYE
jgi:putative ABC transport system permease protein